MISRYEVVLNGKALSAVSADILVLDVNYPPPSIQTEVYTVANRSGGRIYRRNNDKLSVTISFVIRAYDIKERQKICNAVEMWAGRGGVLQINDRESQRLHCVCDTLPTITSAMRWTDPLTVTFTAYALPFWEDIVPSMLTLSGTSKSGELFVPGCVDNTVVEVEALANSTITSLSFTVNGRTLSLSGLSVASGQVVRITYDDNMIQSIKAGNTSILNYRSGVDDLLADCGKKNTCSFTSNVSTNVTFKARGLWV